MYALLLLLLTGMSIPLFRYLLFLNINSRVRTGLQSEREEFLESYTRWEKKPNQTISELKAFVEQFFNRHAPGDDNFHIILINEKLYRSNPPFLLKPLRPDSKLFGHWQTVIEFTRGEEIVDDPEIGSILYKADPLFLDGAHRGVFIIAHATAGERRDALVGVYLFMGMMMTVVVMSMLLSWLGAGWIMAPLRSLSKTARSISESDLNQRIPTVQGQGELAELSDTFNAMMNRIQQSFESQRNFINDAGHELRTPITIIRGHLELLDKDPQERQETVELVIDELDRMGRLVEDMVLLAKSERPGFLHLETIEISLFAEELFSKAKALAQRDWQLTIKGRGKLVGDRQRLTGALLNLLRNAAQYTQDSDIIELGCNIRDNDWVQFWVRDTGEGISPADQQRIFTRFARGQHHQRQPDGSGLGLAIVKAIAEAHGGYLKLVSQLGKGSTFWLILPMEASPGEMSL